MTGKINIFWFRRDLRLNDNHGLFSALACEEKVLPIFIFDQDILAELPKNDARVTFIHKLLTDLDLALKKYGRLAVFSGEPLAIFEALVKNHNVNAVFTNRDYEPYARSRENEIKNLLAAHGVGFKTFKDHVIFEAGEVLKADGKPYLVYTPYSNRWLEKFAKTDCVDFTTDINLNRIASHDYPFLSLGDIGFEKSAIVVQEPEVSEKTIDDYEKNRNFPGNGQTSHLSPHLRFGSVSIREIAKKAVRSRNQTFLKELIWREFFMQILWYFPETVTKSFRPGYDGIKWRNSEADFKKWRDGKTGYPIVDAGMLQLSQTGLMHNRVRMITASFLCKHLLIDWRWGEAYFALKLIDYEQSSNVGNWQWAAGSGVDAAPYFRIFNPVEQQKKFDKEFKYIKKWVAEFGTEKYPKPMIDHNQARERCLKAYREAVS